MSLMDTPTTEQVRLDFMYAYPATPDVRERISEAFDRWLAAHDAEVRAGVVAEEPEWEYAVRDEGDNEPFTDHYDSLDDMREEFDGRVVWNDREEIVRRRKAGPWVPVEQGG